MKVSIFPSRIYAKRSERSYLFIITRIIHVFYSIYSRFESCISLIKCVIPGPRAEALAILMDE